MADNINVVDDPHIGTVPVATDEIGGVHYPVYKMAYGADGSQTPVDSTNPLPMRMGFGDLTVDAWGHPVVTQLHSLFHGLWTFDIPQLMWLVYEDNTEIASASVTGVVSSGGAALLDTTGFTSVELRSKRHPRYQPNRGHRYSTALWCPNKTNDGIRDFGLFTDDNGIFFRLKADGLLYAVVRSGGVETIEEVIDTSGVSGFDVEKGNVYDIQFQWRGVGNYNFFINLTLVHTIDVLGTVTSLTLQNPALPCSYRCTNTTQDVTMHIGCVDIASEGGDVAREQYGSAAGTANGNNTDYPIVSIFNPLLIGTETNTRDLRLAKVTVSSTAKCKVSIWATRTAAALTGESFVAKGDGSYVEVDTTATAMVTANAKFLTSFNVEANAADRATNPDKDTIDFFVTRGDYIIVSYTGNATVDAVIEWGEEI